MRAADPSDEPLSQMLATADEAVAAFLCFHANAFHADIERPMPRSLWQCCPVTVLVSLAALAAHASPVLSQWLQLDFALVADGQWWRIWTGHVTHYDGQHLFWDLLMFAALAAPCEQKCRRGFAPLAGMMMAVISLTIFWWCPGIEVYRGLSGVDTGLFVWLAADQGRQRWLQRDRIGAGLWLSLGAGLIAKLSFEAITGGVLFVDTSTFTPLVEAHLAGVAVGLLCSLLTHRTGRSHTPRPLAVSATPAPSSTHAGCQPW